MTRSTNCWLRSNGSTKNFSTRATPARSRFKMSAGHSPSSFRSCPRCSAKFFWLEQSTEPKYRTKRSSSVLITDKRILSSGTLEKTGTTTMDGDEDFFETSILRNECNDQTTLKKKLEYLSCERLHARRCQRPIVSGWNSLASSSVHQIRRLRRLAKKNFAEQRQPLCLWAARKNLRGRGSRAIQVCAEGSQNRKIFEQTQLINRSSSILTTEGS